MYKDIINITKKKTETSDWVQTDATEPNDTKTVIKERKQNKK